MQEYKYSAISSTTRIFSAWSVVRVRVKAFETGNSINKTAIVRQAACGINAALVFHRTSAFRRPTHTKKGLETERESEGRREKE